MVLSFVISTHVTEQQLCWDMGTRISRTQSLLTNAGETDTWNPKYNMLRAIIINICSKSYRSPKEELTNSPFGGRGTVRRLFIE